MGDPADGRKSWICSPQKAVWSGGSCGGHAQARLQFLTVDDDGAAHLGVAAFGVFGGHSVRQIAAQPALAGGEASFLVGPPHVEGGDSVCVTGGLVLGAHTRMHLQPDRKSTRLNSSHVSISYAVFCLNNKKKQMSPPALPPGRPRRP